MACMGPDLDDARRRGNEIGKILLDFLMTTHRFWDVTDPKFNDMLLLPGARARWDNAKDAFIKATEELFVEDASNGF